MVGFLCSISVRWRKQYDITCEEDIDIMHRNMYKACDPLKVVSHVEWEAQFTIIFTSDFCAIMGGGYYVMNQWKYESQNVLPMYYHQNHLFSIDNLCFPTLGPLLCWALSPLAIFFLRASFLTYASRHGINAWSFAWSLVKLISLSSELLLWSSLSLVALYFIPLVCVYMAYLPY